MFKSFSDVLIMHYLNYFNDLELGFTFGNYEDSPKNAFVERLLKRIGCFTIKRKESHNLNLNYVNQCLIQDVIEGNLITTIF
jgi:hypothetical protein